MSVSSKLDTLIARALSQSMGVELMEQLAGRIVPEYNLHERTGFPQTVPIPQIDAAQQITGDMRQANLLPRFVEVLIQVDRHGVMGRQVPIRSLSPIVAEIESLGFLFNEEYGIFVEGEGGAKTKGWGLLRQGTIYELSFLKLDIVNNTLLVRKYPPSTIRRVYASLKQTFSSLVQKRGGRVWCWEGDGGLAAFYFANKNVQATLTGMEMILELTLYNLFDCPLDKPLNVRQAVHTGPCQFLEKAEQIRSDTLRRLELIESKYTAPNNLAISPGVYTDLGTKLERFFQPLEISHRNYLYTYSLGWE